MSWVFWPRLGRSLRASDSTVFVCRNCPGLDVIWFDSPAKEFKAGTVYQLLGATSRSPWKWTCSVDPFAYVSHLSAMEYRERHRPLFQILYLSTPPGQVEGASGCTHGQEDIKIGCARRDTLRPNTYVEVSSSNALMGCGLSWCVVRIVVPLRRSSLHPFASQWWDEPSWTCSANRSCAAGFFSMVCR